VGTGEPSERQFKERLERWVELLEREELLDLIIAAYEVVTLIPEFTPLLDPQQLKYALVVRKERDRVEKLIEEHGKFSRRNLQAAADRVAGCSGAQRAKVAARLLRDFMLYHRDRRRLEVLNRALEKVNLIGNEKLRDLSSLNGTLYEYLLGEESKNSGERAVVRHVILKADVRDSSRLTRSLLQKDMNPASYFSLNFYDPVNKLLGKYGATKVFVEGDAIILAMLEREGDPGLSVARACVLAREMMEIVGGYNQLLQRAGLPSLELGVGISFQDSSPMYLLDGDHRIMISDALNESDRLSSCDKRIRVAMQGMSVPFNVYEFRANEDTDAERLKYNVGGIRISEAAFHRLREEISLEECKLDFPRLWGNEIIRYWTALVPVGADIFRRLVIRVSQTPIVKPAEFTLVRWTETQIYEVCTNPAVYTAFEKAAAQAQS
jgi:class 3 adenylate cyclase